MTVPQEFHVVPDSFNIPADGILGKDFLHGNVCIVNYNYPSLTIQNQITIPLLDSLEDILYIPPRSEVIRKFHIDSNVDSIINNQEIIDGVFIARTIVNPKNAFVRVLNTTNTPQKISKILTNFEPLNNYFVYSIDSVKITPEREQQLFNILSKNKSVAENTNLVNLCKEYADIFALPSDKMSINNFYTQSLNLIDSEPVYTRNYRVPYSQKLEIKSQVNKLIQNELIEPCASNYNSPIILVPKKDKNEKKMETLY